MSGPTLIWSLKVLITDTHPTGENIEIFSTFIEFVLSFSLVVYGGPELGTINCFSINHLQGVQYDTDSGSTESILFFCLKVGYFDFVKNILN